IAKGETIPEFDAFSYELAASPDFSRFDLTRQTAFAFRATRHAVRIRDLSRIDRLLSFLHAPSTYVTMLTSRKFEAAWPAIERRAGPHLETVAREYVDMAASELIDNPDDPAKLQAYAEALREAGRF